MPFYKQRTHQLSHAPRRPGRSGRPVIQLCLPVSLVGCWSFGWSVGSVHRLSRALTGRSAGWSVVRSVGQSDGLVGPPDRSVDSADRSAGRWVGRRHRADTEASVISPTTSHSNSEHCPRKKTSRLRRPAAGTPLLSGPPMLRWEGDVEKPHDSRPCSIVGPERRGVPAAGRRKRDVFFSRAVFAI